MLQFLLLFPNLLSRPSHGQHRHDGMNTEHYKAGLHSARGQAPDRAESRARALSSLSSHLSPSSSCSSLPSNFLYKAHSLPSVLDPNEVLFSDTLSESVNDREASMCSVWKLPDLSLLRSLSLILFSKWGRHMFSFVSYWFSILSTKYPLLFSCISAWQFCL